MSNNGRNKRQGSRAEYQLAAVLRDHGIQAERNDQRYVSGRYRPDVQANIGGTAFHVECKNVKRLRLRSAMRQAIRDHKPGMIPVVAHRSPDSEWLLTLRLRDTLRLIEWLRDCKPGLLKR